MKRGKEDIRKTYIGPVEKGLISLFFKYLYAAIQSSILLTATYEWDGHFSLPEESNKCF